MSLKNRSEGMYGFRDMKMSKRDLRIFYNSELQRYRNGKELNIEQEKACLKVCFDNFKRRMNTYYLSVMSLIFVCFALAVIMCMISFTTLQTLIVSGILLLDVIFSISYVRKDIHDKEYKKRIHYEACILALNDIEEEMLREGRNRTLTQKRVFSDLF